MSPSQVLAAGVLGAGGVAYLTAQNPHAAPPHLAVAGRVLIITMLVVAGVQAQTDATRAEMGRRLMAAGLFACLWLLNGSSNPAAFSVGVLCSALAPAVVCYLLLAHPAGRIRTPGETRFLIVSAAVMFVCWIALLLTGTQPPLRTPLLRCTSDCPENVLYLGFALPVATLLKWTGMVAWVVLTFGTLAILVGRLSRANRPARRMMAPIVLAGALNATLLAAFMVARSAGLQDADTFGTAYTAVIVAIPLAILWGLDLERLVMGDALASFVNRLTAVKPADVGALMAQALHDPSLQIVFRREGLDGFLDSSGKPVDVALRAPMQASVTIEHERLPLATVLFDRELSDQRRFVEAAGEAAVMWLQKARLEAELAATTRELQGSRRRLMDAAVSERQRIQRDLHDSAQQRLVSLRVRLGLAQRYVGSEPLRAEQALAGMQSELEDTLGEVRSLANGVYPSVLSDYGLGKALRAASRRCSASVAVRVDERERYPRDIEGAVYFTCLEALQNADKHAGPRAEVQLRLRREGGRLRFEVRDSGVGFDARRRGSGAGLGNMRDRIAAVGGTLTIRSSASNGTVVAGEVPASPLASRRVHAASGLGRASSHHG